MELTHTHQRVDRALRNFKRRMSGRTMYVGRIALDDEVLVRTIEEQREIIKHLEFYKADYETSQGL